MKLFLNNVNRWATAAVDAVRRQPARHAKERAPRTLLQTYLISLGSLVLCVTMFFGTTYAWFSNGVTTNSEIHIGMLEVGLYKQEGTNRLDLADSTNKLFDSTVIWEPGYTDIETVQIVNRGDLAFKYVLGFTDGTLDNAGGLLPADVAKYFDLWVYAHQDGNGPAATDYASITADNSGWVKVGTLDTLLAGTPALTGQMDSTLTATTDTYTLALHMQDDASAAVMGKVMRLTVTLTAHQLEADLTTTDTDVVEP